MMSFAHLYLEAGGVPGVPGQRVQPIATLSPREGSGARSPSMTSYYHIHVYMYMHYCDSKIITRSKEIARTLYVV